MATRGFENTDASERSNRAADPDGSVWRAQSVPGRNQARERALFRTDAPDLVYTGVLPSVDFNKFASTHAPATRHDRATGHTPSRHTANDEHASKHKPSRQTTSEARIDKSKPWLDPRAVHMPEDGPTAPSRSTRRPRPDAHVPVPSRPPAAIPREGRAPVSPPREGRTPATTDRVQPPTHPGSRTDGPQVGQMVPPGAIKGGLRLTAEPVMYIGMPGHEVTRGRVTGPDANGRRVVINNQPMWAPASAAKAFIAASAELGRTPRLMGVDGRGNENPAGRSDFSAQHCQGFCSHSNSNHGRGAFDIDPSDREGIRVMNKHGFRHNVPGDAPHMQYLPTPAQRQANEQAFARLQASTPPQQRPIDQQRKIEVPPVNPFPRFEEIFGRFAKPPEVSRNASLTSQAKCTTNSDSVICTSPNFDPNQKVNFVAYFHGMYGNERQWAQKANLPNALNQTSDNTVVVVPRTGASAAALDSARRQLGIPVSNIGHIDFMGHSAGGRDLGRLLAQTSSDPRYQYLSPHSVTAMASMYGRNPAIESWAARNVNNPYRSLHIAYDGKTTRTYSNDLLQRVKGLTPIPQMHISFEQAPVGHMEEPAFYMRNLSRYR